MAPPRKKWCKPLTSNEIVDIVNDLESEDEFTAADIYIDPPGDGLVSDSDSCDERNVSFDNLSRRQLLAPAELVLHGISNGSDDDSSDTEDDIALSEYRAKHTSEIPSSSRGRSQVASTDSTALAVARRKPPPKKISSDVRSLLGRSVARAKATHYVGALEDAARAAELEPENMSAQQLRAKTEYYKCAFERALVLAHRGQRLRKYPPDFAECVRTSEETVKECTSKSAGKVLAAGMQFMEQIKLPDEFNDKYAPTVVMRQSRMQPHSTRHVEEISRIEKQKYIQISRLLASKCLERMAHDKYFLLELRRDERLVSANKQGSLKLQELANQAFGDIEKRQSVLRERRPLYAARASAAAARQRLSQKRKEQLSHAQRHLVADARRLVQAAQAMYEKRDTTKCLENAEFAMEQISRKPPTLLPGKEKFLETLQDIVANAFLDQKRVREKMNESDREKRAFVLLGIALSREPSRDSVLRVRPPAPPRDVKRRLRTLERSLSLSARATERCYILHEIARLHVDTKQSLKAKYYAAKCQSEARSLNQRIWVLNATFLMARCHILQNNRPEARAALIEGAGWARSYRYPDVAAFFDTCVNVSTEGEVAVVEATAEQREKEMVSLMQDDDMRSEAKHLFKRMSVLPAARRFSVMPGARVEESAAPASAAKRRQSINPGAQQPTRIAHKSTHPLGYQDFDI